MNWHIHRWKVLARHEIRNKRGWFECRVCRKCGEERYVDHLAFFSTISDAIDLGIATGIYKGLREFKRKQGA